MKKLKAEIEPKLLEKLTSLADIEAISMVNGIEFSGINIGPTDVSVTLTRQPTGNYTIASNINNTSLPVTVLVLRLPISNITQTMAMVQSSQNLAGEMNSMAASGTTVDLGTALASNPTAQSTMAQLLSTLKSFQIGIGAFVHPNWNSPQTISMGLLGFPRANNSNKSGGAASADVILVVIFPFKGATNIATVPLQ
jgi:hypothetical protein